MVRLTRTGILATALMVVALSALPERWMAGVQASTTVKRMTLSEIIHAAETIVTVDVEAVESVWDGDLGLPFTEVSFGVVEEPLKGSVDLGFRLRFLGGPTPSGHTYVVAGMPRFRTGDRVILFSTDDGSACPVVGWWQGIYRVDDRGAITNYGGRIVTGFSETEGRLMARLGPEGTGARPVLYEEFVEAVLRELR